MDNGKPLKILTFTTMYPNAVNPSHGVFVENRIAHLVASGAVKTRVVAPVPIYPVTERLFPRLGNNRAIPYAETRRGIEALHPRYPLVPKISMSAAPFALYAWTRPVIERLIRSGQHFDLIDAHYFYPDGVAAVMLGRALGKPVVITARGTDLNLIPDYALPRRMILWAAARAAGLVTVCEALRKRLTEFGVPAGRIRTLRNGVDLQLFRPGDRPAARTKLDLRRTTLLSVGHLIERKGHHLIIEALCSLPEIDLLIAGDGPEEVNLRRLVAERGLKNRVRFLGRLGHGALREVYEAADMLVLASSREGWANVLLEAMACGTPVVATSVWGTPEVVAQPEAGELVAERSPSAIQGAVRRLLTRGIDRAATRRYAEGFSWEDTTRGQIELFQSIVPCASKPGSPTGARLSPQPLAAGDWTHRTG